MLAWNGTVRLIRRVGAGAAVTIEPGVVHDVVGGPVWQEVEVKSVRDAGFKTQYGTEIVVPQAFADLVDGRTLRPVSTLDIHAGPARVLVLRGLERIIDIEQ